MMPLPLPGAQYPIDEEDLSRISQTQLVEAANSAPKIYVGSGVTVARVHPSAVLKYGREVRLSEARTMQYVTDHTTVRLPRVTQAWEEEDDDPADKNTGYILMNYIEGTVLSDFWSNMDREARREVHEQVAEFVRQLHSTVVDSPGPIGGDVCNGAVFTDYGAGPFKSIEGLNACFNERLSVCKQFGSQLEMRPFTSSDFQPLVLCHMDLFPRNIILDPNGKIWLLDWGYAGGYPAHFEEVVLRGRAKDFTDDLLDVVGKPHKNEVRRLKDLSFALTTAAVTRPAGYPG